MSARPLHASKPVKADTAIRPDAADIVIGRDVLELVSSSMYIDPLTVFREYVQNAADSIDAARRDGALCDDDAGRIDIRFDAANRSVSIRDNGTGVGWKDFQRILTAIGGSSKRGTAARGFRGVGRLAGLGYAQELIFRTRTTPDEPIAEMAWDCRELKAALRRHADARGITGLVADVVTINRRPALEGEPGRFFEVEMRRVVRLRSDRLMSATAVRDYLAQVAPVPFSPDFAAGADIAAALQAALGRTELEIRIDGSDEPIYRPHLDTFDAGHGRQLAFEELEIVEIKDVDGGRAALAWLMHHPYEGAVPAGNLVKGLRMRAGNMQVGEQTLLDDLFAEPRFNAWSVGEIHVLDRRIVPNGRRDDFEQNPHLNNLLNQLGPTTRSISKRCRSNSIRRNWLRRYEVAAVATEQALDELRQGATGHGQRDDAAERAASFLGEMERIAGMKALAGDAPEELSARVAEARERLATVNGSGAADGSPLETLPPEERRMYERMFDLIYDCSANRVAARKLIDRIVAKVANGIRDA